MPPPPRIYSYIRFSSERQLSGDSLRRQRELIERYTKKQGYTLDAEFTFEDLAVPAFKGQNLRTGKLRFFIEAIREKRVPPGSVLLIESLDRLTRLKPLEALPLFLEIVNAGVKIVTLADGFEHSLDVPENEQMTRLLVTVTTLCRAHEESLNKSKRLKHAWEQKRRDVGVKKYSRRLPSWLTLPDGATRPVEIKAKADTVREIFRLCLAGYNTEQIAEILRKSKTALVGGGKHWTHSYVAQVLRNRSVTGIFVPHFMVNGKRQPAASPIKGYYPQTVTEKEFNHVQQLMDSRTKNKKGGRTGDFLFRKLLFCGYCGAPVYRTAKGRYYKGSLRRTLLCRNAKDRTGCFYVGWEYDEFEKAFLESAAELKTLLRDKFKGKELRSRILAITGEMNDVQASLDRLLNLFESGTSDGTDLPTVRRRIASLETRKAELASELAKAEGRLAAGMDGPAPVVQLTKLLKTLSNPDARRVVNDLLHQLYQRIDLFPAGTPYQFARLKRMHAEQVRKAGKSDGHVSAFIRDHFDRRKMRFFQPVLNVPGFQKRLRYSDRAEKGEPLTNRRDLADDLPDDAEIVVVPDVAS